MHLFTLSLPATPKFISEVEGFILSKQLVACDGNDSRRSSLDVDEVEALPPGKGAQPFRERVLVAGVCESPNRAVEL